MKNILERRETYKPFEYPEAYEFYTDQHNAHWSPHETSMSGDIIDWNENLTESERLVYGQILKSFVQSELHVNCFWAQRVAKWFPKPEIQMMASCFSFFETIHLEGYSYLNDSLGLDDYSAFLEDKTAVAKLNRLHQIKDDSLKDKARSLAIFSACTEGVNLFSSFAILMNMSRFNMLKGLESIVSWSIKDEALHSKAGCWLFRTLMEENSKLDSSEMRDEIIEAFKLTIQLEDDFSLGEIRGLTKDQVKNFIRIRANMKIKELGYDINLYKTRENELKWFEQIDNQWADFFATRVVDYVKTGWKIEDFF